MSSPLKTPKLDTWGHPPTPSCLHPIAYIAYSPSCACATRVYCLQLKSFQGTFLCKCCFCTIFETLVLSYTFQWYELHLDQHFDFKHGKNNFYWFVPKSPAFCLMNSINKLKLNFKTNMKSLHQCTSDVHHNLNFKILLFLMLFSIKQF